MYQNLRLQPEGAIFPKRSKPQGGRDSTPHDTGTSMEGQLVTMNIQGRRIPGVIQRCSTVHPLVATRKSAMTRRWQSATRFSAHKRLNGSGNPSSRATSKSPARSKRRRVGEGRQSSRSRNWVAQLEDRVTARDSSLPEELLNPLVGPTVPWHTALPCSRDRGGCGRQRPIGSHGGPGVRRIDPAPGLRSRWCRASSGDLRLRQCPLELLDSGIADPCSLEPQLIEG